MSGRFTSVKFFDYEPNLLPLRLTTSDLIQHFLLITTYSRTCSAFVCVWGGGRRLRSHRDFAAFHYFKLTSSPLKHGRSKAGGV